MKLATTEFLTFVALFLVEKIDGDGVKKLSVGFGKFELRRSSEPSDLAVLTRLGSTKILHRILGRRLEKSYYNHILYTELESNL